MAQFFKPAKTRDALSRQPIEVVVKDLEHHAKGVAFHSGKPLFIAGALPGERVRCRLVEQKRGWAEAELLEVLTPAAARIEPKCPHYQQCGGCQFQHLDSRRQLEVKQQGLARVLAKFAGVQPEQWAPPLVDASWNYRRVCRLGIQYDAASCRLTLGFRRRRSNQLVAITHCPILAQPLQDLLQPLRDLLTSFRPRLLGHAELYQGEFGVALLLRYLAPLTTAEQDALNWFSKVHACRIFVQQGDEPVIDLDGKGFLHYCIQGQRIAFMPGDFIQINSRINELMVVQALQWLHAGTGDVVLDLFCGLGNFSLPLARRVARVVAVEGVASMVARGCSNAEFNGLDNVDFYCLDLNEPRLWPAHGFDGVNKVLLDPARSGAAAVMGAMARLKPERIVYVSCNPDTLARDAAALIAQGFKLSRLGVVDMFPQTAHMESMALFERRQTT